ncbi:hypothetical protein A7982_12533 [Minicystis rosea]|nr:hypothetical protein A7982_12533 [Minicystis rosea]
MNDALDTGLRARALQSPDGIAVTPSPNQPHPIGKPRLE